MSNDLQSDLGTMWCNLMHDSPMWPIHGEYRCRTCGRHYPAFREAPVARWTAPVRIKTAVPLIAALMLAPMANRANAADLVREPGKAQAEGVLARYLGGTRAAAWPIESVEIHASLPRAAKSGQLEAIRTVDGPNGVAYQIVQLSGDHTVKKQVIARYLNADEQASQTPSSSVALTTANYKFAYRGVVDDGERLAYAFLITPRARRTGLIKGELWLDATTGLPIRRSGYLVKRPSFWTKRVTVTQEDSLRDGDVQSRLTHITVDTRLVGRAELIIAERPLSSAEAQPVVTRASNGGQ